MNAPSSHLYLLLVVWCGLLTVSLVGVAIALLSFQSKPNCSSCLKLENSSGPSGEPPSGDSPAVYALRSGADPSYIELVTNLEKRTWQIESSSYSSLILRNNSIYCNKSSSSLYFVYAQVVFMQEQKVRSVKLTRNASAGKRLRMLVEVSDAAGPVWVGKVVLLAGGESVSLNITGEFKGEPTFWGAFQLQ